MDSDLCFWQYFIDGMKYGTLHLGALNVWDFKNNITSYWWTLLDLIGDSGSLLIKQSTWILPILKLKDFALVLFPMLLVELSYKRKQIWGKNEICLFPLINYSNDTRLRSSKMTIFCSVERLHDFFFVTF